jgi:hypothetical protein
MVLLVAKALWQRRTDVAQSGPDQGHCWRWSCTIWCGWHSRPGPKTVQLAGQEQRRRCGEERNGDQEGRRRCPHLVKLPVAIQHHRHLGTERSRSGTNLDHGRHATVGRSGGGWARGATSRRHGCNREVGNRI